MNLEGKLMQETIQQKAELPFTFSPLMDIVHFENCEHFLSMNELIMNKILILNFPNYIHSTKETA